MSTPSLERYLHDHLAGAAFAIDLLGALSRKHERDSLSGGLQALRSEIERDREELSRIAVSLGCTPGGIKESLARFMEKLSRPKLVSDPGDVFSSFEACETLALGILGKKALWDALSLVFKSDEAFDFSRLKARAEEQHRIVEKMRLDLAAMSLRRSDGKN